MFGELVEGNEGLVLVLDLSAVSFLDSTALGTMVGAVRRLRETGGELRLVLPDSPARRIFELTSLDQVLEIRASRAAAMEA
jgi:anti-sigma B factor antagonist